MPKVTLADIQAAADAKYGPLVIEDLNVTLVNALRLPKEKRQRLAKLQDLIDGDEGNADQHLMDAVRLVAATQDDADRLLSAAGEDLGLIAAVFEMYAEGTQVGEVSPSAS